MYCGMTDVPRVFAEGNGSLMEFTLESGFWVFNMVSNYAYTRASVIFPEIRKKQAELEHQFFTYVPLIDQAASKMHDTDPGKALDFITQYSIDAATLTVHAWRDLYGYLFTKYMDGNIKESVPVPENHIYVNPKLQQPGYGEEWYRRIVKETGDKFKVPGEGGH
jgi:dipeptidase